MTAEISFKKVRKNNNKNNFSQGWHLDWLSLLTAPETLPQCWCLTSWRLWTEMESFHRLDLKQLINTVSVFLRLGFGPHITAHDIQSWKKSDGWRKDCSWSLSPARDFYISRFIEYSVCANINFAYRWRSILWIWKLHIVHSREFRGFYA